MSEALQSAPRQTRRGIENYFVRPMPRKTYRHFDGDRWQSLPEAPRITPGRSRCIFCGGPALIRGDGGNYMCQRCATERGLK